MSKEPWKRVLNAFGMDLVEKVQALSDGELEALVLATDQPTNANCWWLTYRLAPLLRDIAINEQVMREHSKGEQS